jgi:hypothetical protein
MTSETQDDSEQDAEPIAGQKLSPFDAAVQIAEELVEWIDGGEFEEIGRKSAYCAYTWLNLCNFGSLGAKLVDALVDELATDEPEKNYAAVVGRIEHIVHKERSDLTEFITQDIQDIDLFEKKFVAWKCYTTLSSVVLFLLNPRPCCQLLALQSLLPKLAVDLPAINLVSYAAGCMAHMMNDPQKPLVPHCTSVGNSWLHRLGIYLLNCCQEQNQAPPYHLVQLLSLVSIPSSSYEKYGKAARMFDYLNKDHRLHYMHEAPAGKLIGNMLSLELLGALQPNRQEEYFRRIERATAFYAVSLLRGGQKPSIKAIQDASDLSWADAKDLLSQPYFSIMVFEHQCHFIIYSNSPHDCPECRRVQEILPRDVVGRRMPSSDVNHL